MVKREICKCQISRYFTRRKSSAKIANIKSRTLTGTAAILAAMVVRGGLVAPHVRASVIASRRIGGVFSAAKNAKGAKTGNEITVRTKSRGLPKASVILWRGENPIVTARRGDAITYIDLEWAV